MARYELGEIRRSAAVTTFGPGAIVDFRAGDATISAVAAGLEQWDESFPPAGMLNEQAVREERLQKKLGVKGFRLPPVRDPNREKDAERALPAIRFPQWLQCPKCDRIAKVDEWGDEAGRAGLYCQKCTSETPGRRKVYVVPVRFVLACESGHLDEFPWHWWVGHEEGCRNKRFLKLESRQAGLAGLILGCSECGAENSMDGIFSKETWKKFSTCSGRRPWLAGAHQDCNHHPRATQRGASNLYFPVIESALSIPPWSDRLQEALGIYWDPIINIAEGRAVFIASLASVLGPVLAELEMTPEELAAEVERRVMQEEHIDVDNLRGEEYRQFTGGTYVQGLDREFEIRPQKVPASIAHWFSRLVKVSRLREVRAMTGFTRIYPLGEGATEKARISLSNLGWLPAIEVRGEGIFLEFNDEAISEWETRPEVMTRADHINRHIQADWNEAHSAGAAPPRVITPRFLLIHTFAHSLMRQLTLDCGYSSTALRERLYVSNDDGGMRGLLIYTATTDDDGTLGGLQRQGDPDRIERTIVSAIQSQAWCSSDPLCIEDMLAPEDGLSLAACHSCVLAPETSCEEFNRFLDRATLVGTPSASTVGYFRSMVEDLA
ncbi:DUF1998 domain-containing protein [Novacetimonas maltaceti]|uniref:MrfA-like Zn-binding domain-containing protein n=1 Tax=Novacetimonas maltaceti TaxID=1203393 RepID=A0A2S3VYF3_9PROT|nr:DUF1998 domain-containing protein [Novacetimonas maltaceti]POF61627.1 hypothetical protein KMAL_27410 [Novacetimonas maltaceti]